MSDNIQLIPANTRLFSRVHAHLSTHYIAPIHIFGPGELKIPLGLGPQKEEFSIRITAQEGGVLIKMRHSIQALRQLLSRPVDDGEAMPILYQLLPEWFPSCTIGTEAWSAMAVTAFFTEWTPELSQVLTHAMQLSGIPSVWQNP